MKFIYRTADRPYKPTEAWLWTNQDHGSLDWELRLQQPETGKGEARLRVKDFKAHLLSEKHARRSTWPVGRRARFYEPQMLFDRYLRALRDELQLTKGERRPWMLLPAIRDEVTRTRYVKAIRDVLPNVKLLSEPEMVLEYFRLIRNALPIKKGRNSIFLVIDVGAATCNLTFVQSNKDGQITEGETGQQRPIRLRPVYSDSEAFAGRWVDVQLARKIGLQLSPETKPSERSDELDRIEQMKIYVAENEDSRGVRGAQRHLELEDLEEVAESLWEALQPLYSRAAEQQYDNLLRTEFGRAQNQTALEEKNVDSGEHLYRVIDAVIFAGGSTRLPGFKDAMLDAVFKDSPRPTVLEVGDAYAIAAATGALAHVLLQSQPDNVSRLRTRAPAAVMSGVLPFDIELGWRGYGKKGKADLAAGSQTVLAAADPNALQDHVCAIDGWPAPAAGTPIQLALYESTSAKNRRLWYRADVESEDSSLEVAWTASPPKAQPSGSGVPKASNRFLDVEKLIVQQSSTVPRDQPRPGQVVFEESPDVVIDLGMSKTVVLGAGAGTLDVRAFESSGGVRGFRSFPTEAVMPTLGGQPSISPGPESTPESVEPSTATGLEPPEPPTPAPSARSLPNPEPWPAILDQFKKLDPIDRVPLYFGLLSVLTRSVVLVSGPPGAGKSTLVRNVARLLGLGSAPELHEVPVLPHWTEPPERIEEAHEGLVLLDEFNLAQPERYAWELINRARAPADDAGLLVFGTLNIDMASRPPSPKVLDRAFLLEVEAPKSNERRDAPSVDELLPAWSLWGTGLEAHDDAKRVDKIVDKIRNAVEDNHLRQDMLPSHRALKDLHRFLGWHATLTAQSGDLVLATNDQVIDAIVSARLLTRISGPVEQVDSLVEALEKTFKLGKSPRCWRRLKLIRAQLDSMGFCSPWQ